MSTLLLQHQPMVAEGGLWYGQVYVMDTNTGAFYWWPFECKRGLPWRDTEAHSLAIYPRPSPHVPPDHTHPCIERICTQFMEAENITFLHGQHTHRTCHPLSMFGCSGLAYTDSVFQFLPISSNFAQPLKRSGTTFSQAHNNNLINLMWRKMCCHYMRQMEVTPDSDWFSDPQYSKTAHFRVVFYCEQPKAHLCNNHVV